MAKKILITGITGFVGSHLADYILENFHDVEVHGLIRWRSPLDNIKHILNKATLHHGDLQDLPSLISVLKEVKPSRIFHLAAQSYVVTSFSAPINTLATNVIGTANILEAVRLLKLNPHIMICSSAEVYGNRNGDTSPITEETPLNPMSPYGVSKVAEDLLGYQYFLSHGMRIVRTRMFTHTGPRRGSVFAESSFAKQIAEYEVGDRKYISVGNLKSIRTICDVRDAVKAYWLTDRCENGHAYNIGGTETLTMGEVLEKLMILAGKNIPYKVIPKLIRPSDVTFQIPDTTKFKDATGWQPWILVSKTLNDLLNYHRKHT